jgi:hypothetical protein
MTPFYERLPNIPGAGAGSSIDTIGAALAAGATAGVLAHAAATGINEYRRKRSLPIINNPPGGGQHGPGNQGRN